MVSTCDLKCVNCKAPVDSRASDNFCLKCWNFHILGNFSFGGKESKKKEEKVVCKAVEEYGSLPLYVTTGNVFCDFCTKKIVKGWHADETMDFCHPCFEIWNSHEANKWIGIAVKYGAKFPYNFVEFCEFK
jgi:hypothetical protein